MVGTKVAVLRAVSIMFPNFEYRYVVTTVNWLPGFVFSNGLSMSMDTYADSLGHENIRGIRYFLLAYRFVHMKDNL